MVVELMGLTAERVMEFINKNAAAPVRKYIKQTLQRHPILLSVCSITFYCAALCRMLEGERADAPRLITYTRITECIMQVTRLTRILLKTFHLYCH